MGKMAKVFISYKRQTDPDEPLALALHERLGREHQSFIDQTMLVGESWGQKIKEEIEAADYLVLLLSEHSIQSQMVAEEVLMAEKSRKATGRPRLLPVRVGYEGDLPYQLGAVLNPLQYALWRTSGDTDALVDQLLRALKGGDLPSPKIAGPSLPEETPLPAANPRAALEAPEGTMPAESPFYVRRKADSIVADEQRHPGYTLNITGPRQMGKSSLLGQVMAQARAAGKQVAFLDFQAFGRDILADPDTLYRQFSFLIEDSLELESELDKHWGIPLAPPQKCRRFMERRILPACGPGGLLLAIDEADSLLDSPARSDFFGMLRSWHNERALKPSWKSFSLALVISTEPAMLIENLSQSPFNVGTSVALDDFTPDEVAVTNEAHGSPLGPGELKKLNALLSGHPYLTRKALYLICKGRYTFAELIEQADSETGPFGDHLRALMTRLQKREGLSNQMRAALAGRPCDTDARLRLIAGGLIRDVSGSLVPRNTLYQRYFRRVLGG
jgi:AAA-like domain/TIR domain